MQEEGFEDGDEEGEKTLQDFVNYIKVSCNSVAAIKPNFQNVNFVIDFQTNKVVVLEDIAVQFKLKTQQAIDRIQQMQVDGIITGVIDDRGKFIYISEEELEAVAKFVKQRGRVSITELVENSNMLIDLSPSVSVSSWWDILI